MMDLKNEKGSITLFVLVSCMFFISTLVCMLMYMRSKQKAVDREYKQIKANYESSLENIDETYNKLAQSSDLEVEFRDVFVDTQAKKITTTISAYILNMNVKNMKYGWFYNSTDLQNPDISAITDWTYVQSVEGTNKILVSKDYSETNGYYYLCFMVNDKLRFKKINLTN